MSVTALGSCLPWLSGIRSVYKAVVVDFILVSGLYCFGVENSQKVVVETGSVKCIPAIIPSGVIVSLPLV